jgi:AGCS family alanine or glycine:cation symporter
MYFKDFFATLNETITFYAVFPAMILLGIYLTIRLKGLQFFKLKEGFINLLDKKRSAQGSISHFEAISTVLAGNFGTGNISGMAVAITTGGPGALVWMWVMAFFGSIIQYSSCVLSVRYRIKDEKGEYLGGPMYYLENGLGFRELAIIFSLLTLFGAVTAGVLAQINSMTLPMKKMGIEPFYFSLFIAFCVGLVTLGGLKRVSKLASVIVPFMAVLYLGSSLIILCKHLDQIMPALALMFKGAIDPTAVSGGVLGAGVFKALTSGFDRGLFATDAGTGLVPILQASARTTNPVVDGLVTLVTPFMVMIVCTTTGLVILTTGVWQNVELQSTNVITQAFQDNLGNTAGSSIVIIALVLFGYTTILAWSLCADKAMYYLLGRSSYWFKYLFIVFVPLGTLIQIDIVWILSDVSITLMLIANLIGVALLSKEVIQESRVYFSKTHALS